MPDEKRKEIRRDEISNFWMQVENSECFDEITIYTVEVPVREHKSPEVIDAKQKEIENLEKYGVFEEVEDEGQETVDSRWVITRKEKVATMLRELMKMFFIVAANEDFDFRKIDIRAVFLQAKQLNRDIFLKPPKDIKK